MSAPTESRTGPRWFQAVSRGLDHVARLFQTVAEIMLAVMLVINIVNIVLRNSGQSSLLWVSPWTGVLMVWAVFLAFYVMYRRHLDIVLTIFIARFGQAGMKISRILTALAGLIVVGVLLAELPQIVARQRGIMELIGLTRYWLSLPLIASAFMLALHFLFDLVAIICGWSVPVSAGDEEATQW